MILVLNILDYNKATWLVLDKETIKYSQEFTMARGEDATLLQLDKFLKKNKLKLEDIKGLALAVKSSDVNSDDVVVFP